MVHISEKEFTNILEEWFEQEVGEDNVHRQVYQPEPYWFVDLVVERPEVTWYIEVENDAALIRDGVGQALGYASDRPRSQPMVIVPAGHTAKEKVERLRQSQAVLIREFDDEGGRFLSQKSEDDEEFTTQDE